MLKINLRYFQQTNTGLLTSYSCTLPFALKKKILFSKKSFKLIVLLSKKCQGAVVSKMSVHRQKIECLTSRAPLPPPVIKLLNFYHSTLLDTSFIRVVAQNRLQIQIRYKYCLFLGNLYLAIKILAIVSAVRIFTLFVGFRAASPSNWIIIISYPNHILFLHRKFRNCLKYSKSHNAANRYY